PAGKRRALLARQNIATRGRLEESNSPGTNFHQRRLAQKPLAVLLLRDASSRRLQRKAAIPHLNRIKVAAIQRMEQLVRECSKLQQWHRVGLTLAELV